MNDVSRVSSSMLGSDQFWRESFGVPDLTRAGSLVQESQVGDVTVRLFSGDHYVNDQASRGVSLWRNRYDFFPRMESSTPASTQLGVLGVGVVPVLAAFIMRRMSQAGTTSLPDVFSRRLAVALDVGESASIHYDHLTTANDLADSLTTEALAAAHEFFKNRRLGYIQADPQTQPTWRLLEALVGVSRALESGQSAEQIFNALNADFEASLGRLLSNTQGYRSGKGSPTSYRYPIDMTTGQPLPLGQRPPLTLADLDAGIGLMEHTENSFKSRLADAERSSPVNSALVQQLRDGLPHFQTMINVLRLVRAVAASQFIPSVTIR